MGARFASKALAPFFCGIKHNLAGMQSRIFTACKVRYWSTQSREDFPWYEHHEVGFNYRMSNILAALGRGQLERLPELIERRRHVNAQD